MAERQRAIAVDLGGTRFRVALFNQQGTILHRRADLTDADAGQAAVIDRLITTIRAVMAEAGVEPADIAGIGVGVPGPVDPWAGVVAQTPNLPGWRNVPVKAIFERALDLPVHVGNDANLAAIGELTFGAGRGVRDLIYLTVSTGIGGGIITGGRLLLGSAGLAGEPGHMTLKADGPPCGCGNRGCLEALASGTAIANAAARRIAAGEATRLRDVPADALDAVQVVAAAEAGDDLAVIVVAEAANYLGLGIAALIHLFNPRLVLIGGGVANAGPRLFDPVRATVQARCMTAYLTHLAIERATLGDDAGLHGAAAIAFEPRWQATPD